jgi:ketosteroid isomerase-like protein
MNRRRAALRLVLACSSIALVNAVLAQTDNRRQMNRLAVVEAERAFARAAATKGTREAFLEFLADDGIIFQPGPVNGKQFWRERAPGKGLLSWQPVFADVSRAGDLGYTTGPFEFRPNGAGDKPVAWGQYFTIWKKQPDNTWKAVLDRGTGNPQPSSPAAALQFPKDERDAILSESIDPAAGRELLRELESQFSRALSSQGMEKAFQSRLADDARLFREDSFPAVGKRAAIALLVTKRGVLTWKSTAADISRSGDLGYTYGAYEFKGENAADKLERGNYVRVWKKEMGSKWKVVIDILSPVPG